MAIEVVRCQVVLPYTSGVPEDVATNTFHVRYDTADIPTREGLVTAAGQPLIAFYNDQPAGAALRVAQLLSPQVDRGSLKAFILFSWLSDPEPRVPEQTNFTLQASLSGSSSLPSEVALCLSFRGSPVSGVPPARQRGRIFLGPLHGGVPLSTSVPSRPGDGVLDAVRLAAGELKTDLLANDVTWGVWSRTSSTFYPVDNGWVDDEFDVQRRRGNRRTKRVTFSG